MFSRILVPVDGSDHARKAVALAADLAQRYGAELVLFHVLLRHQLTDGLRRAAEVEELPAEGGRPTADAVPKVPEGRFPADIEWREKGDAPRAVLDAVARFVLDQARSVARDHGIAEARAVIADADPADAILGAVDDEGADLVVMGSRGLGPVRELLTGSVSQKVGQRAPCTVVSVR
jgi:nucleotide-binding universal stress UspA family protein